MMRHDSARRADDGDHGRGLKALASTLLKTAGWIVALPALCAAVIAGGVVPLYLLLPPAEPKPAAVAALVQPAEAKAATPAAAPLLTASIEKPRTDPAAVEPAGPSPSAPAADLAAPAEAPDAGEAPAEDRVAALPEAAGEGAPAPAALADPDPEPAHLGVVPTPRPLPAPRPAPMPAGMPGDAPVETAAVEPPSQLSTPSPALDRVSRAVNLRAGPRGAQIGVLPKGTAVSVSRCEEWCEVESAEGNGWIHSSFLAGAERRNPPRSAARARPAPAETRAAMREDDRYDRPAPRRDDPDWLLPDEPIPDPRDGPGVLYYEVVPDYYR